MAKKRQRSVESAYQVFVSHATTDKWIAKTFCEKIEATGVSTFRDDRDINGGDSIPDEIRNQIRQSHELLVLLTPESINRTWVILEIGAAWMRQLRIVPLLCHVTVQDIPDIIKDRKAFHINDFDQYVAELAKRMTK